MCIIVRIIMHLDPGTLKDGAVIIPAGLTDPGLTVREIAFDEVRPHFQRPGAAYGLDGGDALLLYRRVCGAKQQFLYGAAVVGGAFHRQVRARCGRCCTGCFSLLHRI